MPKEFGRPPLLAVAFTQIADPVVRAVPMIGEASKITCQTSVRANSPRPPSGSERSITIRRVLHGALDLEHDILLEDGTD